MLKLRLQRRGKRNFATYRVVVADERSPIKGRFIADVGSYNPHTSELKVDKEVVAKWLAEGVRPSDTVNNLLITNGIIKGEKVAKWHPKKQEAAVAEQPAVENKTAAPAEEAK